MRRIAVLVLFASVAGGGCAARQSQATAAKPTPTTVASAAKDDPNRIVCEQVHVPGTRVTRKACYRKGDLEEWSKDSALMPHNDPMEQPPPKQ